MTPFRARRSGAPSLGSPDRRPRRQTVAWLAVACLIAGGAEAGTRTVTGTNGTTGEAGLPAADGQSLLELEAVPGDSTNSITLQAGHGGEGGRATAEIPVGGDGGRGGDAQATAESLGGQSAIAKATGGNGGRAGSRDADFPSIGGRGGDGGAANASAVVEDGVGSLGVNADARATGGAGGSSFAGGTPGDGGSASLGRVFASASGDTRVVVRGAVVGGAGGFATLVDDPLTRSGNGAAVSLVDAVGGVSGNQLRLLQLATGGAAGGAQNGVIGRAGEAHSVLEVVSTSYDLYMMVSAEGGAGGARSFESGVAGAGADGRARAVATPTADGLVDVTASGTGGSGGTGSRGAAGGRGGNGSAEVEARTDTISDRFSTVTALAQGGAGGGATGVSSDTNVRGGAGGDAFSTARAAHHLGHVAASSTGGHGGGASSTANGGDGGNATSRSFVEAGTSRFADRATASAIGGNGGTTSGVDLSGGRGGNADAESDGVHAAQVFARGGAGGSAIHGFGGVGGDATAIARAAAPSGNVSAIASAQVGAGGTGSRDGMGRASTRAEGSGHLLSRASVDGFDGIASARSEVAVRAGGTALRTATALLATSSTASAPEAAARGTASVASALRPTTESIDHRLDAGNFRVRRDLDPGGSSDVFAHASFATSAPMQLGTGTFETFTTFGISLDAQDLASPQNLVVGLLDPIFSGDATSSELGLRISTFVGRPLLFDAILTPEDFTAQLDDRTLDLGSILGLANYAGLIALSVELRLTSTDPNASVALDFFVANTTLGSGLPIPEPSTALLLLSGLIGLASERSRDSTATRSIPFEA